MTVTIYKVIITCKRVESKLNDTWYRINFGFNASNIKKFEKICKERNYFETFNAFKLKFKIGLHRNVLVEFETKYVSQIGFI